MEKTSKFCYKENVEIISGFYRNQKGIVSDVSQIRKSLFGKKIFKYSVWVAKESSFFDCEEDHMISLDK